MESCKPSKSIPRSSNEPKNSLKKSELIQLDTEVSQVLKRLLDNWLKFPDSDLPALIDLQNLIDQDTSREIIYKNIKFILQEFRQNKKENKENKNQELIIEIEQFYIDIITKIHLAQLIEGDISTPPKLENDRASFMLVLDALGQSNNPITTLPIILGQMSDFAEIINEENNDPESLAILISNLDARAAYLEKNIWQSFQAMVKYIQVVVKFYKDLNSVKTQKIDKIQEQKKYIVSLILLKLLYLIKRYQDYFQPESFDTNSFVQQVITLGFGAKSGFELNSKKVSVFLENEWLPLVNFSNENIDRITKFLTTDLTETGITKK